MEFIYIVTAVVITLVLWSIIEEKKQIAFIKRTLQEEWAKVPESNYSTDRLNSIKAYYKSKKDINLDIDDITWNDLDMDELYQMMNNTQSSIGEEYLYRTLRKPSFSNEILQKQNRIVEFFQSHEKERIEVQLQLYNMGKIKAISVYEYLNRLGDQERKSNLPHLLMNGCLLLSLGLLFITPAVGGVLLFVTFGNNIYQYYKRKSQIDNYLTVLSYMLRLFNNVDSLVKVPIKELEVEQNKLLEHTKKFKKFRSGSGILVSSKVSGSILDAILDYLRMMTHIDLMKYNKMIQVFHQRKDSLEIIFETVGAIDTAIAVASFRESILYYSLPKLQEKSKPYVSVKDLYHPLIGDPITNSIKENRSVLITGSNASGKSTFIKNMAINSLLSQTIYTSTSKEFHGSFFRIFSSMALRDSIFQNESYYIVEIKSLKRILDQSHQAIPVLCFIDEVLRGTNTIERIAASSQILLSISRSNALCFAATHDIELTHILEKYYSNYHFQERIKDKQILFDYKLYQGRAISKNAIKLLDMLGYDSTIIRAAEHAANHFSQSNEWSVLS